MTYAALEHEPELDVLRSVLGISGAIVTRAESALGVSEAPRASDIDLRVAQSALATSGRVASARPEPG